MQLILIRSPPLRKATDILARKVQHNAQPQQNADDNRANVQSTIIAQLVEERRCSKRNPEADEPTPRAKRHHGNMAALRVAVHGIDEAQHDDAHKTVELGVERDDNPGPCPILWELTGLAVKNARGDSNGEREDRRDEAAFGLEMGN